jgi:pyruvate formate lyase activating enzyme
MEAGELAGKILKNADMLRSSNGGVTLSGGEVLMQPEFLLELLSYLMPLHRAIETCGHAPETVFRKAINACDHVLMDLKLMDSEQHKRFTGVGNELILRNFEYLRASGKPFIVRIPLIPGVNDDRENLIRTAEFIAGSPGLLKVELLPYHASAGAKYKMAGMTYDPQFDTAQKVHIEPEIFSDRGIRCDVL